MAFVVTIVVMLVLIVGFVAWGLLSSWLEERAEARGTSTSKYDMNPEQVRRDTELPPLTPKPARSEITRRALQEQEATQDEERLHYDALYRNREFDEAVEEANTKLDNAVRIIAEVPEVIEVGYQWLESAHTQYSRRNAPKFWEACVEARRCVDKYNRYLSRLSELEVQFYTLAVKYPNVLPPFVDAKDMVESADIHIELIESELWNVADEAQRDVHFANQYMLGKINATLEHGFAGVRHDIQMASLRLTHQFDQLRASIDESNSYQVQQVAYLARTIESGTKSVTSAINDDRRAQQTKADAAIRQLKAIKRHTR